MEAIAQAASLRSLPILSIAWASGSTARFIVITHLRSQLVPRRMVSGLANSQTVFGKPSRAPATSFIPTTSHMTALFRGSSLFCRLKRWFGLVWDLRSFSNFTESRPRLTQMTTHMYECYSVARRCDLRTRCSVRWKRYPLTLF